MGDVKVEVVGVEPAKDAVSLRVIAEGEMTVEDSRVHVGGVAMVDLLDHLPSGRYVSPAKVAYGEARVTVEILKVAAA